MSSPKILASGLGRNYTRRRGMDLATSPSAVTDQDVGRRGRSGIGMVTSSSS